MTKKKKIFLRILKEIGRLALIALIPYLFTGVFSTICYHNHIKFGIYLSTCVKYSGIIFFSCLIVMGIVLSLFVYLKKISKLWLIEGISFYLILFITGQIVDYVTSQDLEPSSFQMQDTLGHEQELKEINEGVK